MNCPHCNAEISEHDFNCPSCHKLTARTREDLNRVDPRVTRGIGFSLIAVGGLGFVFVIANSWTDWFSGLDFVGPLALLLAGVFALSTIKKS
ncbi:MAG: hypothetical protein EBS38_07420 [Actinobacteria bacterium]|nr:hypothetical protein [Actinomycetota bacterium]